MQADAQSKQYATVTDMARDKYGDSVVNQMHRGGGTSSQIMSAPSEVPWPSTPPPDRLPYIQNLPDRQSRNSVLCTSASATVGAHGIVRPCGGSCPDYQMPTGLPGAILNQRDWRQREFEDRLQRLPEDEVAQLVKAMESTILASCQTKQNTPQVSTQGDGEVQRPSRAVFARSEIALPIMPPPARLPYMQKLSRSKFRAAASANSGTGSIIHPSGINSAAPMGRTTGLPARTSVDHGADTQAYKQATEENANGSCVVCWAAAAAFAVVPCGHLCVCGSCVTNLQTSNLPQECPLCRGSIEKLLRIYRS